MNNNYVMLHEDKMTLNAANIAVISFFGCAFIVILLRWPAWLLRVVFRRFEKTLSGDNRRTSPTLLEQLLHVWDNEHVCPIRYLLLLLYIGANAFLIFAPKETAEISRRSAVSSTVNLVPAILSGRTRILIEALNLSYQQHNFAHKWFARISFIEALVHSAIVLHTGMPRTVQATCGLVASTTSQK